ncbi:MAG: hypothetical protein FJW32_08685 [Acidobacteria bacterium]|nr:hypothetical protein [Acidobacteriota bacterium]
MARAIILSCLLLGGCTKFYRYERLEHQDLVVPPRLKSADISKPVTVKLRGVPCEISTASLRLSKGRLTLEPVGQDQPTRAPLAVIEDFHKFRARLDDCAPDALQRVVTSLPMSTWLAHQFLYGGSLDVRAPLHFLYVGPGPGNTVIQSRYRVGASIERISGDATPLDAFAQRFKVFRLLYLSRGADANHAEILVGASSREVLWGASGSCAVDGTNFGCFVLRKGAVLRPEVPLMLDGKPVFAPLHAAAREIAKAKIVSFKRNGVPVRASGKAALEQILLMGGEEIWTVTPKPRGKTAGTS